jgi:hypothetical protein
MAALGSADDEAATGAEVAEETMVTTGASVVAGAGCSTGVAYEVGAGAGTVTGIVVPSVSVTKTVS